MAALKLEMLIRREPAPSLKRNAALEPSTRLAWANVALGEAPETLTVCAGPKRSASATAARRRRGSRGWRLRRVDESGDTHIPPELPTRQHGRSGQRSTG